MTAAGDRARGVAVRTFGAPGAPDAAAWQELEFARLYERESGAVLAYLLAVTRRPEVAEELLQETFCRLLAQPRSGTLRGSIEQAESRRYLFRIATNLLRDRWRAGVDKAYPEPDEASHTPDPGMQLDVHRALARLSPRERELLWLAYVEGMNHAEIAQATGLARLSVRLLLFRARNKAQALLTPGLVRPEGTRR